MALAAIAAAMAFALTGTNLTLWRYVTIRDFGTLLGGATAGVLGLWSCSRDAEMISARGTGDPMDGARGDLVWRAARLCRIDHNVSP